MIFIFLLNILLFKKQGLIFLKERIHVLKLKKLSIQKESSNIQKTNDTSFANPVK